MNGKVLFFNIADQKGYKKTPIGVGRLVAEFGFQDDAHAGDDVTVLPTGPL